MTWHGIFDPLSFDRARRKEAYRRFGRVVRRKPTPELLQLTEVEKRLGLFERTYVGIEPIPVAKIVGSSDRTHDFDRNFLPLRDEVKERWQEIERQYPLGNFPPIVVYQVDDAYFLIDGHHRVAVAKHKGVEFIDAEITRLHSRSALPADADIGRIILTEQERLFMEESGLARARPDATIELSRAHGYPELLEIVRVHGYLCIVEQDRVLTSDEIAADWYDRVYIPTVEAIRTERLTELASRSSEADIFLWVYQRRRELFPERGSLSLEDAVKTVGEEQRARPRQKARRAVQRLKPPAPDQPE